SIMGDITERDLMRVRLRLDDFPVLYSYGHQMRLPRNVFMKILSRYPEEIQTELMLELLDAGYWGVAADVIQVFPLQSLKRLGRLNHQAMTVVEWAIRQANRGIIQLLIRRNVMTHEMVSTMIDLNLGLMPHKKKGRRFIHILLSQLYDRQM